MLTVRDVEIVKKEVLDLQEKLANMRGAVAELKRQGKETSAEAVKYEITSLEKRQRELEAEIGDKLDEYKVSLARMLANRKKGT